MNVFLWKKNGEIIRHTDRQAAIDLDGLTEEPHKTVTVEEWEAAGSTAYISGSGKIVLGIPSEVKSRNEEIQALNLEEASLQTELDSKDYKVTQAAEVGQVLKDIDPALHERRQWCRIRIKEIRERLSALSFNVAA